MREFLTGKLLSTFLDLVTLCVLLPFLFYLNPTLAWIVVACAALITLIILAYLRPLRTLFARVSAAETWKYATLGETITGIKTVKALALEPQRRAQWDERIAEAGKWRLAFARLANWPQTLVNPIERMMVMGTMLVGAYLALNDPTGYMVGGLFAFMMLSQRVAQPLVGLARLVEDYEEVGAAIGEAGSVLNRPLEIDAASGGMRPKFAGAISFQDVTFTYVNTKTPALERVSFAVAPGTMLGIVGRSGSGKSTTARLLQGINRDYSGSLKLDGTDLREINLRHLRQSFGVVLQDNFLFRGSIRDNIIAGRPGLSMRDAVNAARLAGAEEFIERMPNGYETYIEEGSPNLSGGQKQRIAIARALIHDPRILILDEATSALDPESEAVVSANLLRIAQGRTMVIVSHRLSSLIECDQTLVLDQGKVVDIGPHEELVERCLTYRQLWNQQNRHLDSRRKKGPHGMPRNGAGAAGRGRAGRDQGWGEGAADGPPAAAGTAGHDPADHPGVSVALDGHRQRADPALGPRHGLDHFQHGLRHDRRRGADPGRRGRDDEGYRGVPIAHDPRTAAGDRHRALHRRARGRDGQGRPGPGSARSHLCHRRCRRADGAGRQHRGRGDAPPGRGGRQAPRLYRQRSGAEAAVLDL